MMKQPRIKRICITTALAVGLGGAQAALAQSTGQQTGSQEQQSSQQDRQQGRSGQGQSDQSQTLSGTISNIRQVEHDGERHVHVDLRTSDGQNRLVDLGPDQGQQIRQKFQRGDEVRLTGQRRSIGGESTFAATEIRTQQETAQLGNWWAADASQQAQASPRGGDQSSGQDRSYQPQRSGQQRGSSRENTEAGSYGEAQQASQSQQRQQDRQREPDQQSRQNQQGQFDGQGGQSQFRQQGQPRYQGPAGERRRSARFNDFDEQEYRVPARPPVGQDQDQSRQRQDDPRFEQRGTLEDQRYFEQHFGPQQQDDRQSSQQQRQYAEPQYTDGYGQGTDQRQQQSRQRGGSEGTGQANRAVSPARQGEQTQPAGYILVNERLVFMISDQFNRHLVQARMSAQQQDTERAATELKLAADYLDMYAGAASDDTAKGELQQARRELEQLAERVGGGQSARPRQIDQAVARAHQALAKHHLAKMKQFQENDQTIRAGYGLHGAANHLMRSIIWSDQDLDRETDRAIRRANEAAGRLVRGEDVQNQQQVVSALSRQIEGLDLDGSQQSSARQAGERQQRQGGESRQQQQQRDRDRDGGDRNRDSN